MKKVFWLSILSAVLSEHMNGQELEARAYTNLPKGMNAVALAYALSKGSVIADASLPVEDFDITAHNIGARYVRTFGLAGKLARLNIALPFVSMKGKLKIAVQDTAATRNGFADMRVQVGINLIGSPALTRKEFATYRQKTIVGVSLITSLPTGQYFADKRINLGNHRWGFKPEIGASTRFKQFYVDGYVGMWLYTKNTAFLETKELKQEPLLSTQLHVSYYFKNGMMVGADGNWYSGGKRLIDNAANGERIDHWRAGITCAAPFSSKHLVKLQFHTTIHTTAGASFYLLAIGYQYVFF